MDAPPGFKKTPFKSGEKYNGWMTSGAHHLLHTGGCNSSDEQATVSFVTSGKLFKWENFGNENAIKHAIRYKMSKQLFDDVKTLPSYIKRSSVFAPGEEISDECIEEFVKMSECEEAMNAYVF
ncbi:hypothetical protein SARC_04896 [Sphaeroforma arctica JP610]|uniref:Uncharacterized protein n=1 Tax=Sphaeroforma arctica JP610 TaxID=667725 RepID=A0A0L0G166_9EUKA|nr:hypothetical protein SARC_04896 [Sphaeroforma arctica JP610]KNC82830.1 hypothetical protein SARC_04896 [Sphaeroforma arctica JP610]|eukprot:XP_014156732.1 hypothetical protein SARC_04896 [Sphaeroforma arctica JP610]